MRGVFEEFVGRRRPRGQPNKRRWTDDIEWPLYCFQIDIFVWLHVTDIYIYIYLLLVAMATPETSKEKTGVYIVYTPASRVINLPGALGSYFQPIHFMSKVSQALRDPSSQKGQVKSNTLTCAARHNGCVPNQIAGKV